MNSTNNSLFVVVVVVLTFAVGMATFLNYYKFKSLIGRLMASRVLVIGNEIQDNIEQGLSVGLSLQENNTIQGLIERESRADDLIKSIVLFDVAGRVLFSTETAQLGTQVASDWVTNSRDSSKQYWTMSERNAFVAGIPLRNNFGISLGHVAITYTRKPLETAMGIMGNVLLQTALIVLLLAAAAAFGLLVLAFRRYRSQLLLAEQHLGLLLKELEGGPHPGEDYPESSSSPFLLQVQEFIRTVRSTADAMKHGTGSAPPLRHAPGETQIP